MLWILCGVEYCHLLLTRPVAVNTWRDRSRIAGGRAGEGGIGSGPPTPFRAVFAPPQPPPDNRSTTRRWLARNVGWWLGDGNSGGGQKAERDGRSAHDAGPENRQPFPSLHRAAIDGWARNSRDGRVFHVARQGEAYHALSRRFATTSGFVNPLPVSRRHLYALYFLIRWAF